MFIGYSETQHNFYNPSEKTNIITDIKNWCDDGILSETYFYQIRFDKLMNCLDFTSELINRNIGDFVIRTADNKTGTFVYKKGGRGLEYFHNRQLDFVKAYKFLKSQPTLFYAPVTLFSPKKGIYAFHPGSAKMQLANLFSSPPMVTIIFTPRNEFENHEYIYDVLEMQCNLKAKTSDDNSNIAGVMNLNSFTGDPIQLKLLNFKGTDATTIEISEDHRDISGFVNEDDYIVEIQENSIRVNSEVILYKVDNIWKTEL